MGDNIIGGTGNVGHLFRCDTNTDICTDLGQAIPGMEAIGSLVVHNGLVYGGTALWGTAIRLFVYDPETDECTDLGVFLWFDYYANALVVGNDGRLYGASGPDGHLFAYDLVTGEYSDLGEGAPGEEIHTLIAAPDGMLYGGSSGAYLFRYDPGTGSYTDLGQPVPDAYSVQALALGAGETLHGGTGAPSGVVFVYDRGSGSTVSKGRAAWGSNMVYTLLPTESGVVYGGGMQLFAYEPAEPSYRTPGTAISSEIIPAVQDLADAPGTYAVNALSEGMDGLIYGGGGYEGRLFAYDPAEEVMTDLGQVVPDWYDDISCMTTGTEGKIYGGTSGYQYYSGRLFIYDPAAGVILDRGQAVPGESGVYAMTTGEDGKIYGGTSGSQWSSGQLFAYDPGTDAFEHLGQVNEEEYLVAALTTGADGRIYGGTGANGHLFAFDPETGLIVDLWTTPSEWDEVSSVVAGGDGKIYGGLGASGRLITYDPAANAVTDLGQPVSGGYDIVALVAWQDLIYGVSTQQADGRFRDLLFVYDTSDGSARVFGQPLPDEWYTNSLAAAGNGRVYGGSAYTYGHLFSYDPQYPFDWGVLTYSTLVPVGTAVAVDVLDMDGVLLLADVENGGSLAAIDPALVSSIRLRAEITTDSGDTTPWLQDWTVAWPSVEVEPTSLLFRPDPGDPDIVTGTVQIRSTVGETVDWTVAADQPWLSCHPASGITPHTITVTVDKSGLALNTWHAGQVSIEWLYEYGSGTESVDVAVYIGALKRHYLPLVMQNH